MLGENSLYTVEAWTTFLNHLSDQGLLSVSRWYFHSRPAELFRTTTIAVEALRRLGVSDPRRHIAIVRHMQPGAGTETPDGVGTIIVSRRPFSDDELDTLDRVAARLAFDVPFSPRAALDETFVRLTRQDGLDEFLRSYPINIAAPTDDSPFFFNMLRLRDLTRTSLLDFGSLSHNMKAVATLGVLLGTVTVLTTLCLLLPLWVTRHQVQLAGAGPFLAFFFAIGLGFMLIETALMQRLIIALGHPDVRAVRRAVLAAAVERPRKLPDVGVTAERAAEAGRRGSSGSSRSWQSSGCSRRRSSPASNRCRRRRGSWRRSGSCFRPGVHGDRVSAWHAARRRSSIRA